MKKTMNNIHVPDPNAERWDAKDCAWQAFYDHGNHCKHIRYNLSSNSVVVEMEGRAHLNPERFYREADIHELCKANGVHITTASATCEGLNDSNWISIK